MSTILGVGIATVDIIHSVVAYPRENDEVRAISRTIGRGGNVANTLVVLSQLQHRCYWAGCLSDEQSSALITRDLEHYDIDYHYCVLHPGASLPTSYVTLNQSNGSRTIVHYRDLPEFGSEDFTKIPLDNIQWIHFEGRNVLETEKMMRGLRQQAFAGQISVEIEKPRPDIERLFPLGDIILFSRHFANSWDFQAGPDFLQYVKKQFHLKHDLVCAWGEQGAYALTGDGTALFSPAQKPAQVLDTLGAGDVFNAGLIHCLIQGQPLLQALNFSTALAGIKCGQHGFDGLNVNRVST